MVYWMFGLSGGGKRAVLKVGVSFLGYKILPFYFDMNISQYMRELAAHEIYLYINTQLLSLLQCLYISLSMLTTIVDIYY